MLGAYRWEGLALQPHPPDEFAEICINGGTARWTAGAPAPDEAPGGTEPADDGLGFHEQHDVHKVVEAAGQGTDDPAIESAQARAFDLAADDDELLSKEQVLGDQGCAGRDEGQDEVEQEAKKGDHGSDRVPRWCVSGTAGDSAGQGGRARGEVADPAPRFPRHRRRTRSRSSSRMEYLRPTAFEYDATSDKFRPATSADKPPQANDARCGLACHTTVKARDYVFTEYAKR